MTDIQYISDAKGNPVGVFVPIEIWHELESETTLTESPTMRKRLLEAKERGETDDNFWLSASEDSLNEIWTGEEDDVYAELLENEIVLVRYPFSDLTNSKVRPAVVVNTAHASKNLFIVALTSKTQTLMAGEFVLLEWQSVGLNVATAVKRGVFTIHEKLVLKTVGALAKADAQSLDESLREWFDLP